MPTALLKMDHPCFFDFLYSDRVGDGFRPRGGLFCLFRSDGIFAGPHDDFCAGHTDGTHHNSRPDLESSTDKCKRQHRTIGIGIEEITKRTCLRSCKPPEDTLERSLSVGLPAVCGCSFSKARSCCFGLFLFVSELNGKKTGMKRIKRIFQILQEERELNGELKTKHNFSTHHNMIKSTNQKRS